MNTTQEITKLKAIVERQQQQIDALIVAVHKLENKGRDE